MENQAKVLEFYGGTYDTTFQDVSHDNIVLYDYFETLDGYEVFIRVEGQTSLTIKDMDPENMFMQDYNATEAMVIDIENGMDVINYAEPRGVEPDWDEIWDYCPGSEDEDF